MDRGTVQLEQMIIIFVLLICVREKGCSLPLGPGAEFAQLEFI